MAEHANRQQAAYTASLPTTPDIRKFEILNVEEVVGPHGAYMVVDVKFPNYSRCAYEGAKVVVYQNVSVRDVLFWREIDPHFRDPAKDVARKEKAPPPVARFPGSATGRVLAVRFARMMAGAHDQGAS